MSASRALRCASPPNGCDGARIQPAERRARSGFGSAGDDLNLGFFGDFAVAFVRGDDVVEPGVVECRVWDGQEELRLALDGLAVLEPLVLRKAFGEP